MADPTLTAREYAYVRITGPGQHGDITARLGLQPTEAWNLGDVNPKTGRLRRYMAWEMRSGLDDTSPLEQHIAVLLTFLKVKAAALRELWVDYDITLECVGYYPRSYGHGVHFNREVVRQAAQLGIAIDCDMYFVDEPGSDEAAEAPAAPA